MSQTVTAGGIKVSDMICADTKVSKTGEVTGSIKKITGSDELEDGHWFPTELETRHYGKTLHAGGKLEDGELKAGKDFTPSESDPYLVICVEHCTDGKAISIFDKDSKTELFKLDFSKAKLL